MKVLEMVTHPAEHSVKTRPKTVTHAAFTEDTPTLYVLVGPPLSGKTTYAEDRVLLGASNAKEVLSMDDLDEADDPIEVFLRVLKARSSGTHSMIADATNLKPEKRRKLLELAESAGLRPVAVVFDAPLHILLDRAAEQGVDQDEVTEAYHEYQRQRPLINREFDVVISGA